MAKKITLKNKNGDVLCPHTAIEQVQGLKEALEGKLGKNEPATSVVDGSISTSKIADAAITPVKIQTSIALNGTPSMTVEPTLSSPDKTMASVGLVKEAVDGIEIGGVNLILNSDFSRGVNKWSLWVYGDTLTVVDKIATATFKGSQGILRTSPFAVENGKTYVVSFDVKSSNITSFNYCYLMSSSGNVWLPAISNITTSWQRLVYKFTATTTGTYMFGFGVNGTTGATFQISNVKVEKGNKATDWTPSPEDVEAKIEAVKPTIFLQTLQPSATEVKEGDIWIIQ